MARMLLRLILGVFIPILIMSAFIALSSLGDEFSLMGYFIVMILVSVGILYQCCFYSLTMEFLVCRYIKGRNKVLLCSCSLGLVLFLLTYMVFASGGEGTVFEKERILPLLFYLLSALLTSVVTGLVLYKLHYQRDQA